MSISQIPIFIRPKDVGGEDTMTRRPRFSPVLYNGFCKKITSNARGWSLSRPLLLKSILWPTKKLNRLQLLRFSIQFSIINKIGNISPIEKWNIPSYRTRSGEHLIIFFFGITISISLALFNF